MGRREIRAKKQQRPHQALPPCHCAAPTTAYDIRGETVHYRCPDEHEGSVSLTRVARREDVHRKEQIRYTRGEHRKVFQAGVLRAEAQERAGYALLEENRARAMAALREGQDGTDD